MAKKNNFDELNKLVNKSNVGNKTNASFNAGSNKPNSSLGNQNKPSGNLNDLLNKQSSQRPTSPGPQKPKEAMSMDEFFKQNIGKTASNSTANKAPQAQQSQAALSASEQIEKLKQEQLERLKQRQAEAKQAEARREEANKQPETEITKIENKNFVQSRQVSPILPTYKDKKELQKELLQKKQQKTNPEKSNIAIKANELTKEQNALLQELKKLEERENELLSQADIVAGSALSAKLTESKKPITSLDELIASKNKSQAGVDGVKSQKPLKAGDSPDLIKSLEEMAKGFSGDKDKQEFIEVNEKKEEILDRLRKLQEGQVEEPQEKRKKRGFFWIFFLIGVLLLIIATGIIIFNVVSQPPYEYVRINVNINNKDVFFTTNENGERVPIQINPGTKLTGLNIKARNSKEKDGDKDDPIWNSVFMRFKISLLIDGVENNSLLEVNPDTDLWHRYNEQEESKFTQNGRPNGLPIVMFDDGYYYFKDILKANEEVLLLDEVTFSLYNITEDMAGKSVSIVVQVEVLENFSIIEAGYWADAPRKWMSDLRQNLEELQPKDIA